MLICSGVDSRRFHAAHIDALVCSAVLCTDFGSLPEFGLGWADVYEAATAYGNMRLAQHTDRLEDWAGLWDR
jgi:hypothetical protein